MKNRTTLIALALILSFQFGSAQSTSDFFSKANTFFSTYVKSGRVDYSAIKKNPASLNELIEMASTITVSKSNPDTYKAFWINGYNLNVINGIVEKYPVKSPMDISGFFDKIKRNVGGKQIVLNDIENKMLRAVFPKESRFHFVLVCAGLGCPPIVSHAYMPSKLESQLQKQTTLAMNSPSFTKVNGNKVQLSQIFEWYKEDFTHGGKSEIDFVNQFRKEKIPADAKVSYYKYNWALNKS